MKQINPLTNKDIKEMVNSRGSITKAVDVKRVLEAKQLLKSKLKENLWGHDYSDLQTTHTLKLIDECFKIEEEE